MKSGHARGRKVLKRSLLSHLSGLASASELSIPMPRPAPTVRGARCNFQNKKIRKKPRTALMGGYDSGESMDVEKFGEAVVHRVYHIPANRKVPLHQHPNRDEVFFCVKGSGVGVLGEKEIPLAPGTAFVVPAGTLHTLRADGDLYVASSLFPMADDPEFAIS
jgi:mannose-6-phosphate isomerase-like protein (cupin superfamily)